MPHCHGRQKHRTGLDLQQTKADFPHIFPFDSSVRHNLKSEPINDAINRLLPKEHGVLSVCKKLSIDYWKKRASLIRQFIEAVFSPGKAKASAASRPIEIGWRKGSKKMPPKGQKRTRYCAVCSFVLHLKRRGGRFPTNFCLPIYGLTAIRRGQAPLILD